MTIALNRGEKFRLLRLPSACTREAFMKKIDRMREKVTILPTSMYLSKMHDAGWSLVALEWEREVESTATPEPEVSGASEEIPFGLRISSDCHHLEDDPLEMQTLKFLAEMIVQDISFKSMAEALNIREYRTRDGRPWNAANVFRLTPRLIEVAPRILSGAEWESRKKQLTRVAWNS
jgi:hypothetical protein